MKTGYAALLAFLALAPAPVSARALDDTSVYALRSSDLCAGDCAVTLKVWLDVSNAANLFSPGVVSVPDGDHAVTSYSGEVSFGSFTTAGGVVTGVTGALTLEGTDTIGFDRSQLIEVAFDTRQLSVAGGSLVAADGAYALCQGQLVLAGTSCSTPPLASIEALLASLTRGAETAARGQLRALINSTKNAALRAAVEAILAAL